ncbi:MAG TPA: hypothetical protein PLA94_05310 [Myxococcota bacterium]|nr:hypothetical protein [Myxococcota bacterium]
MIFLLLACVSEEPEDSAPPAPAPELPLPDLDGIDLPAAVQEALSLAVGLSLGAPWQGNVTSLTTLAREGCPDFYVGAPPEVDIDTALSWADTCRTSGGLFFDGYLGWDQSLSLEGDPEEEVGQTVNATRSLAGNGSVGDDNGLFVGFDGEGEEALYRVTAPDHSHWTWSSLVQGTVEGSNATALVGGWRSDLYLYSIGGDAEHLEARGNAYFPELRIQDRFDSLAMDLVLEGALGATSETCTLEPAGWIGLRDEQAFWYDLVFMPLNDDGYTDDPYSACDGCGQLFLRGVEAPVDLGTVCVDLSGVFTQLVPPNPEDFVFTLHQTEAP